MIIAYILAFYCLSVQATPECPMQGKIISSLLRKELICLQKRMIPFKTPHTIQQTIHRLTHDPRIIESTKHIHTEESNITWEQLEQNNTSLLLVGFGSLMHIKSPINSPFQPNINIPCLVFGIKRLYSMIHPHPEKSCIGLPSQEYEHEQLQLDTNITGNIHDYANGILLSFKISSPAYQTLKKREQYYNLVPITAIDYRSLSNQPRIVNAYILNTKTNTRPYKKKPHVLYNQLVLDGAYTIEHNGNPGFISLFLDSTFLPNGTTTVRDWLIQQKDVDCSSQ